MIAVELALRYSIRGRFDNAKNSARFNVRVDELFATIKPDEEELAAIVRHAHEIGAVRCSLSTATTSTGRCCYRPLWMVYDGCTVHLLTVRPFDPHDFALSPVKLPGCA